MFQVSPFVESIALRFQQSSIHCLRLAPQLTLRCLAWFWRQCTGHYAPLAGEKADADHRFYALDLPLHGKTNWNEADDFNRQSLV